MTGYSFNRWLGADARALRILLLANICASLLLWLAMAADTLLHIPDSWVFSLLALPSNIVSFLWHPWTLLTYMVSQANVLQLLFNILWLMWFGRCLLDTDRSSTLWLLYIGGGVAGGVLYLIASVLTPGSGAFLMGSSASILAVMVYTAIRQPHRQVPLLLIGEVSLRWIAVAAVLFTLLGGSGIAAHLAHVGGAAFPVVLLMLKKRQPSLPGHASPKKTTRRKPAALNARKPLRKPSPSNSVDISDTSLEEELDRLLDKIRISGFDSLSADERRRLDAISSALGNNSTNN